MSFDDWLDKHERVDKIYTWVHNRTVLSVRDVFYKRQMRKDLKPYSKTRFFLDHGWTPAAITDIDDMGGIRGVSMVNGKSVVSDLYHCGPMPVCEKDAWKIANLLRKWEALESTHA